MSDERYEIRGKIGQGGVGAVYRAFDRNLSREVAIKRVLTEEGYDPQNAEDGATRALLKEATALCSIQHPHIVTVYDAGVDQDGPFVIMELLSGRTLDEVAEDGPMSWPDFRETAVQSLEALIAAQDLDLVHRDLKPSNVMVTRLPSGKIQIKLVDFGLAKFSAKPSLQTIDHGDAVFGSIHFMAPEQFERVPLDRRTDMYSLGCVFYYCLTGKFPFDAETAPMVMVAHLHNTFTPLREHRPDLPDWVCQWVEWHIARQPDDRPDSAREALERFWAFEQPQHQTAPVAEVVPATQIQSAVPYKEGEKPNRLTGPVPLHVAATLQNQSQDQATEEPAENEPAEEAGEVSHGQEVRAAADPAVAAEKPTALPEAGKTAPDAPGTTPDASGTAPDASGTAPEASGTAPEASGTTPDASGTAPDAPGTTPEASGTAPDASGTAPDASGTAPDASGMAPDASGTAPDAQEVPPKTEKVSPKAQDAGEKKSPRPVKKAAQKKAAPAPPAEKGPQVPAGQSAPPAPAPPAAKPQPPVAPIAAKKRSAPVAPRRAAPASPSAPVGGAPPRTLPPAGGPVRTAPAPASPPAASPVKLPPLQPAATPAPKPSLSSLPTPASGLAASPQSIQPQVPMSDNSPADAQLLLAKKKSNNAVKVTVAVMLGILILVAGVFVYDAMGKSKVREELNQLMKEAANPATKEVALTGEQVEAFLAEAATIDTATDKGAIYQTLYLGKAADGTDIDQRVAEFATEEAIPEQVRDKLFQIVERRGGEAGIPYLLKFAEDSADEAAVEAALDATGENLQPRHLPTLYDLIAAADSPQVRGAAERAVRRNLLVRKNNSVAAKDLLAAYEGSSSAPAKETFLRLLGTTARPEAEKAIESALASEENSLVVAAYSALANWRDDSQFARHLEALQGEETTFRRSHAFDSVITLLTGDAEIAEDDLQAHWTSLASDLRDVREKRAFITKLAVRSDPWAIALIEPLTDDPDDDTSFLAEKAVEKMTARSK
ncbi:serine/threonine-protein kinase [Roseibacillus ishigakijimensis]|uniref:non-specific serine/threonine protein kinase n=1 Tax=Roseibacillus ishigakijimensis TaxID=454146 RepID=A0A934RUC3_9BACT|nr:serine/threonine-protein kinase [Roseibacillus ishigakijimensis]MBK1835573.1 protein kinase [Roseibacillus ishigakijimensis]